MKEKLIISKLDAAKRQIEVAIKLYFSSDDPVSIHTLASAAFNVLRDINKSRGGERTFSKDLFLDYIVDGHEGEVWALINRAENFFKHADRDPEDVIEFRPEQTDFILLEACSLYSTLTGEDPVFQKVYRMWFMTNNPEVFKLPHEQQIALENANIYVKEVSKLEYFQKCIALFSSINV